MLYGEAIPKDFEIPKNAFWIRNDLSKSNPFKNVVIKSGDVVLDCGAFVGTFASAALEQGAKRAICFEANPNNFAICKSNMTRYEDRAETHLAALVSGNQSSIELYLSGFSGAHTIVPNAKSKKIVSVDTINFARTLREIAPQVVKLDVEGAEYDLLSSLRSGDLASVNCIFIEFHPCENREQKVRDILKFLDDEGLPAEGRLRATTAIRIKNDYENSLDDAAAPQRTTKRPEPTASIRS